MPMWSSTKSSMASGCPSPMIRSARKSSKSSSAPFKALRPRNSGRQPAHIGCRLEGSLQRLGQKRRRVIVRRQEFAFPAQSGTSAFQDGTTLQVALRQHKL